MESKEIRLFKNWWLLLIKGIIISLFGLIFLFRLFNFKILIISFIIITLINGLLILFGVIFYTKHNSHWIYWLIEGLFDFLIGITGIILILMMKVIKPHVLNLLFIQILALWALIHGIIHSFSASRLKQYIPTGRIAMVFGLCVIC